MSFKNALTTGKLNMGTARKINVPITGLTKEADIEVKRIISAAVEKSFNENYADLFKKIDKHVTDYVTSTLNSRANEIKQQPFKLTEDLASAKEEALKALKESQAEALKNISGIVEGLEAELKTFKTDVAKETQKTLTDFRNSLISEKAGK